MTLVSDVYILEAEDVIRRRQEAPVAMTSTLATDTGSLPVSAHDRCVPYKYPNEEERHA